MKKLLLPRKSSKAYKTIYNQAQSVGYRAGYERGCEVTKTDINKRVVENDVEIERRKTETLKLAGQAIQSLSVLGEAFARVIMYGSDQGYPKKNERSGF